MKRFAVLMCVIVVVLVASVANAQQYKNLARGATAIAAPTFSSAWFSNPAVLAGLNVPEDDTLMPSEKVWRNEASVDIEVSGDNNVWALDWGGYNSGSGWGIGAGYVDSEGGQGYGVGVSRRFGGVSVGVNLLHVSADGDAEADEASVRSAIAAGPGVEGDEDADILSIGVYKYFDMAGKENSSIVGVHAGAVYQDITDEVDGVLNLGVALDFVQGWTLAADLLDFDTLNIGASTRLGKAKEWEVAAGLADGDLTVGATYDVTRNAEGGNWRVGLAWADFEADDVMYAGDRKSVV